MLQVDKSFFVLDQCCPCSLRFRVGQRALDHLQRLPPYLCNPVKGLRATAIIAQRRIQWRGDGVQLDIFLDAQHFLETEDEWTMAIVPVIQEFGATEMQKTNLIMISPFLSIWLITDLDASFST